MAICTFMPAAALSMKAMRHLIAEVVTFRRTILSSASLYRALRWTLGFQIRRVLQDIMLSTLDIATGRNLLLQTHLRQSRDKHKY